MEYWIIEAFKNRFNFPETSMSLSSVKWSRFYGDSPRVPYDVRFKVLDISDPPNFKVFSAHKLLLAAASSTFESQFYGELFEDAEEVYIEDSHPDAFEKLLQFIYLGKKTELAPSMKLHDIKTIRLVYDVMVLADKYMINEYYQRFH